MMNQSSRHYVSIDELTRRRAPLELLDWVEKKMDEIGSTDEGERDLRLGLGLLKPLIEEVYPLAIFGYHKYGKTKRTVLQPVVGSQGFDALVLNLDQPDFIEFVEITQCHSGEDEYLRRLALNQRGYTFGHGPVTKMGTKKTGLYVSIKPRAVSPVEVAEHELTRISAAARRKADKDYPANTSLVIVFDDDSFFRRAIDNAALDRFIKSHVLELDLRFSTLYLVGWKRKVFREYSLPFADKGK